MSKKSKTFYSVYRVKLSKNRVQTGVVGRQENPQRTVYLAVKTLDPWKARTYAAWMKPIVAEMNRMANPEDLDT